MTSGAHDRALERAEAAVDDRHDDPQRALDTAVGLLDDPTATEEVRVVALWAKGLAERELNRLDASIDSLEAAASLGRRARLPERVRAIEAAIVTVLVAVGRPEEGLRLADEIADGLEGPARADLEMRRALAFEQIGRIAEAVAAYTRALRDIVAGDDRILEARARCNRSIALAYQGEDDEALADALAAEQLAREAGQALLEGGAAHNAAFVRGRMGDVVAALADFDRADAAYRRVGYPGRADGVLASDRAAVLVTAGLFVDAVESAELAVEALDELGDVIDLAEARLLLARARRGAGDPAGCVADATLAAAEFDAAGRPGWAALARYVAFVASEHDVSAIDVESLIAALDDHGWVTEAIDARIGLAERLTDRGDLGEARALLESAAQARHRGSPDQRAAAWHATALLRAAEDNRVGAQRAVTRGLDIIDEQRSTLLATELRIGLSEHATKLAELGVDLAFRRADPRRVLTAAERARANALVAAPVRRPSDAVVVEQLSALRRIRADLDAARGAGQLDPAELRALRRQEREVRDRARLAQGAAGRRRHLDVPGLVDRVGDRQLVEYVQHDGELAAVVVTDGRCRLHRLGRVRELASLIDEIEFAQNRLARHNASAASVSAARVALSDAADRLHEALVGPLRLADRALTIVPTGPLHRVCWGAMPVLDGLPVSVSASASRWDDAANDPVPGGALVAVAGPDLDHAPDEVGRVGALATSSVELTGEDATVARVIDEMAGTTVAHLACHGQFRADSPMFSSLRLADGPMTVFDIEQLASPPALVALPACGAAVSHVSAGDEVVGTATALLNVGVGVVIAPTTAINDETTPPLMEVFHREIQAGTPPSAALATMRRTAGALGDSAIGAASSFVCFG